MRVLIVEDDPQQAEEYRLALAAKAEYCEISRTISDAMSVILRRSFDLVVLDILLPDGNTLSLADYLRMRHPDTAILSITGSNIFPCGDHVGKMSTDYLLRKPLQQHEFAEIACYLGGAPALAAQSHQVTSRQAHA